MPCYNIYIFDRHGTCLYYHEWHRPKPVQLGAGSVEDDHKNMFSLCFSLRTFTAALDPTNKPKTLDPSSLKVGEGCTFHSFQTNNYKLHFLEVPSGLKFILNTSPEAGDLREHLWSLYSLLFVEYVTKNPLYDPSQSFNFEKFTSQLNRYIESKRL